MVYVIQHIHRASSRSARTVYEIHDLGKWELIVYIVVVGTFGMDLHDGRYDFARVRGVSEFGQVNTWRIT